MFGMIGGVMGTCRRGWPAGVLVTGWCALATAPAHSAPLLKDGYAGTLVLPSTDFSENDVGNSDPSATYPGVSGYGTLTISYGPYFTGQGYFYDPSNPAPPFQTSDAPSGPLTLATAGFLSAVVADDNDAPKNPVVGGSVGSISGFFGPVAILFSTPVVAVQLTVGNLAEPGQVTLEAFGADGMSLGALSNGAIGFEIFDLYSTGGLISGLSLRSANNGDSVAAAVSGVGVFGTPVPGPGASALALPALALAWSILRKSRRLGRRH